MISLIAAIGMNRELGKDNELLWNLPSDLRYFKSITQNKICIQGRSTYQSIINQIGYPLPKRQNVILTRNLYFQTPPYDNCHVYHSLESILYEYRTLCESDEEVIVIGGGELYNLFLPYADRLYITVVEGEFESDTFFPSISDEWRVVSIESHEKDDKNVYNHHFLVYEKK